MFPGEGDGMVRRYNLVKSYYPPNPFKESVEKMSKSSRWVI